MLYVYYLPSNPILPNRPSFIHDNEWRIAAAATTPAQTFSYNYKFDEDSDTLKEMKWLPKGTRWHTNLHCKFFARDNSNLFLSFEQYISVLYYSAKSKSWPENFFISYLRCKASGDAKCIKEKKLTSQIIQSFFFLILHIQWWREKKNSNLHIFHIFDSASTGIKE